MHFTVVCRRVWGLNGFGGMERGARGLADGLAERGHRVHVITAPPAPGYPTESDLPFDVTYLDPIQRHGIRGFLDYRRWTRAVAEYLPDVETDLIIAFYGDISRAEHVGAPRVVFTYGLEWLVTPGFHGWGLCRTYGPYQREGMRRAEYLATCGAVHLLKMHEVGDFTAEPFQTQNWVRADSSLEPPREEARRQLGLPEGGILVSSLSRLAADKQVHLQVEAIRRVRRQHPDVQLVIAGDGPERQRIEQAAGDDPGIRMLGQVDDSTARLLLRASDTTISVARSEYQMFSVIESLGLGTPVACAYADRMEGIVMDGLTGFVLPDPSSQSIERAITRLATMSPQRRGEMAQHAAAAVGERYRLAFVARQFEDLALMHQ